MQTEFTMLMQWRQALRAHRTYQAMMGETCWPLMGLILYLGFSSETEAQSGLDLMSSKMRAKVLKKFPQTSP